MSLVPLNFRCSDDVMILKVFLLQKLFQSHDFKLKNATRLKKYNQIKISTKHSRYEFGPAPFS